jgi:hypothetical protein
LKRFASGLRSWRASIQPSAKEGKLMAPIKERQPLCKLP